MSGEVACERLAAAQHGVVSRSQALEAGMSSQAIDRRVAAGRWRVLHPGVYVPRPVPASWRQQLMAAVLRGGASALASHRSAAVLWHLHEEREAPIEVSIKASRRIQGVTVHRRRDDPAEVLIEGIPATGIERTLLDLATVVNDELAGQALDQALRHRLTTLVRVRSVLHSMGPRGRPGTRALRRLIGARDHRDALAESRLESRLLRVLREHELPPPIPQFKVVDGDLVVARLDFAYPELLVGIEADGYRWHGNPEGWRRDLRRENRLKLLGWTLLRFSWEDVHDRPEIVAAQVRAALAAASVSTGAGASPILHHA